MKNKKHLVFAVMMTFVLCSGFVCTPEQVHGVKVANADFAQALKQAQGTVADLSDQGQLTKAEEGAVATRIIDLTVFSDRIDACANAPNAKDTLRGCVTPILQAAEASLGTSLGIKNATAQASVKAFLDGAILILNRIAAAGGTA